MQFGTFGRVTYLSYSDTLCRSLDLAPGKEEVVVPQADVRISNASLGEKLADQSGRTVVKVTYSKLGGADSDEEEEQEEEPTSSFILCALTAGKVCRPLSRLRRE